MNNDIWEELDELVEEDGFEDVQEKDVFDDETVKELFMFFNSFVGDESLKEMFVKGQLPIHFKKHCLGTSTKKSNRTNVYYDFKYVNDYKNYENKLSNIFSKPNIRITNLYDKDLIKSLKNLFKGNYSIELTSSCGFSKGRNICIYAYSSDVTTNYLSGNTIDICIRTNADETVTLYPLDANYFESKLNNILSKYTSFSSSLKFNDYQLH